MSDTLFVIPARGGSKGVPGKNIKLLNGIPLIHYSIFLARKFSLDKDICVTTDSEEIQAVVEKTGLRVPFLRPAELAKDQSGMQEVLIHALSFYEQQGRKYKKLVLLQPTSPFRKEKHIEEAMGLYKDEYDMVVSVMTTESNPYFKLMKEREDGFLYKVLDGDYVNRQAVPDVYELNGAVYVINAKSVMEQQISAFKKVKKYQMDKLSSLDIDSMLDWEWAEYLVSKNIIKIEL